MTDEWCGGRKRQGGPSTAFFPNRQTGLMFGIFVVASPAGAKHGTAGLKEKTKAEILEVACPFPPSLTSIDRLTGPLLHTCPCHHRQVRATGREQALILSGGDSGANAYQEPAPYSTLL